MLSQVQQVQSEITFQDALRTWLHRTPIHGSMRAIRDEDFVLRFIDAGNVRDLHGPARQPRTQRRKR